MDQITYTKINGEFYKKDENVEANHIIHLKITPTLPRYKEMTMIPKVLSNNPFRGVYNKRDKIIENKSCDLTKG